MKETDFLHIFHSAPVPLLVLKADAQFTIVDASDEYLQATMTHRSAIVGCGVFEVFPDNPEDPLATGTSNIKASLDRVIQTGKPHTIELQKYDIPRPQSLGGGFEERYWRPHNVPVINDANEVAFIIHRAEDVTDNIRLQQAKRRQQQQVDTLELKNQAMHAEILRHSRELEEANVRLQDALGKLSQEKLQVEALLEAIGDAVITTDAQGHIIYMNKAAESLSGHPSNAAIGQDASQLLTLHLKDGTPISKEDLRMMATSAPPCVTDYHLHGTNGKEFIVAANISPIWDKGEMQGAVIVMRDVTQERKQTEVLKFQARHDALTGLANRIEFQRRLRHAHEGAQKGSTHVLCMIDLDGFKQVNDMGGHEVGDDLLRQIARHLGDLLRQRDTLARLGGDEFACLLEHCSLAQGEHLACELLRTIENVTVHRDDRTYSVGASIGVTLMDAETGHPDDVLRAADAACYTAKAGNGNKVRVGNTQEVRKLHTQDEPWLKTLRHALKEDDLALCAQPIVPMDSASGITHQEILLRLPTQGTCVKAAQFMAAAHRHRLAPELDRWVINATLAHLAQQEDAGFTTGALVFINIAEASLTQESLPAYIEERMKYWKVPASRIVFEISEDGMLGHQFDALLFARSVRSLGCRLSLDDVLYSLPLVSRLKELRPDFIKPSCNLTQKLDDPPQKALLEAIHHVSMSLNSHTIAKCPLDGDTVAIIQQMGIPHVQGDLIAEACMLSPRPLVNESVN